MHLIFISFTFFFFFFFFVGGCAAFKGSDVARLTCRSKSLASTLRASAHSCSSSALSAAVVTTLPPAAALAAEDVNTRFKRLYEYSRSEIKLRSTRQAERKATSGADRGITYLLWSLAEMITSMTSSQVQGTAGSAAAPAVVPGQPSAAETASYFNAVLKRLEQGKPDEPAALRVATVLCARHFFEHNQSESGWKLMARAMELATACKPM